MGSIYNNAHLGQPGSNSYLAWSNMNAVDAVDITSQGIAQGKPADQIQQELNGLPTYPLGVETVKGYVDNLSAARGLPPAQNFETAINQLYAQGKQIVADNAKRQQAAQTAPPSSTDPKTPAQPEVKTPQQPVDPNADLSDSLALAAEIENLKRYIETLTFSDPELKTDLLNALNNPKALTKDNIDALATLVARELSSSDPQAKFANHLKAVLLAASAGGANATQQQNNTQQEQTNAAQAANAYVALAKDLDEDWKAKDAKKGVFGAMADAWTGVTGGKSMQAAEEKSKELTALAKDIQESVEDNDSAAKIQRKQAEFNKLYQEVTGKDLTKAESAEAVLKDAEETNVLDGSEAAKTLKNNVGMVGDVVSTAGALIGGAIGSIIPGGGTLIGAAIGGAAGKMLVSGLSGQAKDANEVLVDGVQGAIFGALPVGIGGMITKTAFKPLGMLGGAMLAGGLESGAMTTVTEVRAGMDDKDHKFSVGNVIGSTVFGAATGGVLHGVFTKTPGLKRFAGEATPTVRSASERGAAAHKLLVDTPELRFQYLGKEKDASGAVVEKLLYSDAPRYFDLRTFNDRQMTRIEKLIKANNVAGVKAELLKNPRLSADARARMTTLQRDLLDKEAGQIANALATGRVRSFGNNLPRNPQGVALQQFIVEDPKIKFAMLDDAGNPLKDAAGNILYTDKPKYFNLSTLKKSETDAIEALMKKEPITPAEVDGLRDYLFANKLAAMDAQWNRMTPKQLRNVNQALEQRKIYAEADTIAKGLTGQQPNIQAGTTPIPTEVRGFDQNWGLLGKADSNWKKWLAKGDQTFRQRPLNWMVNTERKMSTDIRNWAGEAFVGDDFERVLYPWEKPGFVQPAETFWLGKVAPTATTLFTLDGMGRLALGHVDPTLNHAVIEPIATVLNGGMPMVKAAGQDMIRQGTDAIASAGANGSNLLASVNTWLGGLFQKGTTA